VRRSTFLLATADIGRSFNDITELVRQVILAAHCAAINSDTRTNRRRRHRHNCEDHPFRPGVLIRQSEKVKIRIRHLLEDGVHLGRCDETLIRLHRFDLLSNAISRW
jgi:hypothetical protein